LVRLGRPSLDFGAWDLIGAVRQASDSTGGLSAALK